MEEIPTKDIVRTNVKYYRIKGGITQSKMAELLGISEKHYSRLETGNYAISFELLDSICKILGVESRRIFDEKNSLEDIPKKVKKICK